MGVDDDDNGQRNIEIADGVGDPSQTPADIFRPFEIIEYPFVAKVKDKQNQIGQKGQ